MSGRQRRRQRADVIRSKRQDHLGPEESDSEGGELDLRDEADDEIECPHCRGDGADPMNDYLLTCPRCRGERTVINWPAESWLTEMIKQHQKGQQQ